MIEAAHFHPYNGPGSGTKKEWAWTSHTPALALSHTCALVLVD